MVDPDLVHNATLSKEKLEEVAQTIFNHVKIKDVEDKLEEFYETTTDYDHYLVKREIMLNR